MNEKDVPQEGDVNQEEAVNQILEYAAMLILQEKRRPEEVQQLLIDKKGLDAESAAMVVQNVSGQIDEAKKSSANKDMLYGALWCVGGIIVTVVTMSNASGGGTYVVAWGAIIFGAIQFIKGAVNSQ